MASSSSAPVTADCEVCCESLVKSVNCARCNYKVCVSCTERFLLDLNADVQCMNCKQPWTREFMAATFSKKFLDGPFKEHKKELLLDIEKGLMPETQPFAEHAKAVNGMIQMVVKSKLIIEHYRVLLAADNIMRPRTIDDLREKARIEKKLGAAMIDIKMYKAAKALNLQGQDDTVQERRIFVKPCPAPDCRGFLSTHWNCGLCTAKVCSKCHEIKGEGDHTCNEDILKTVQLMATDSKPCPKCGEMITRISGCPQMFHTPLSGGCGAIFDWNTLRLTDSSHVHNPHWFEYQRQMNNGVVPRTEGDNGGGGCGDMPPSLTAISKVVKKHMGVSEEATLVTNGLYNMIRGYLHVDMVQLPAFRVNDVVDNRDLRIQYLLDAITEDKLKANILMREKARDKKREYGQIMQMFIDALRDILHRVIRTSSMEDMLQVIKEVDALSEYTDISFARAQTLYKSTVTMTVARKNYTIIFKSKPRKTRKAKSDDE